MLRISAIMFIPQVMDAMRKINFGQSAILQDFGIGVSNTMERVNARVLNPPTVTYDRKDVSSSPPPSSI